MKVTKSVMESMQAKIAEHFSNPDLQKALEGAEPGKELQVLTKMLAKLAKPKKEARAVKVWFHSTDINNAEFVSFDEGSEPVGEAAKNLVGPFDSFGAARKDAVGILVATRRAIAKTLKTLRVQRRKNLKNAA